MNFYQLTSNNASYFEKLSVLLMNFSKHCPRYSEYQVLYADSVGLRDAVCKFLRRYERLLRVGQSSNLETRRVTLVV